MMNNETKNQNVVSKIKSQITRLKNAMLSMEDQRNNIKKKFSKSLVGKEITKVHKVIIKQSSTIDNFKVTDFVNEFEAVLEKNQQNEQMKNMHFENYLLIAELEELNNSLLLTKQKKEEIQQQMTDMKMELNVLDDLLYCDDCNKSESI